MKGSKSLAPITVVALISLSFASLAATTSSWKWSGSYGEQAVELLIIGDVQVQQRSDPTTAFMHVTDTLNAADLVYANLEGMLVASKGYGIDIPDKKWVHPGPEGVLALQSANIDVVGVANNVAYGRHNILETLRVLEEGGIQHVGAGKNIEAAHEPAIVERRGVTIGILQYTARWYVQEEQIATATEAGVARIMSLDGVSIDPSDLNRMENDVRRLRPQVDVLIVSQHNRDGATPVQFGRASDAPPRKPRDQTQAEEYQKRFAHTALDAGSDLVFGHGTHTLQGVELYHGKPILYALGHSVFDQPGYEESTDGLVVRVVIDKKKIARVSFVPVTRDESNNVLMLDPETGEGARLVELVRRVSGDLPLSIDGKEVVLLDRGSNTSEQ